MSSLFNLIKKERKLSFDNWRYRLLHWYNGISPETPEDSTLPRYLYTHYCPLFHLTNMLLVLFPFAYSCVLLYKLFVKILQGFLFAILSIWSFVEPVADKAIEAIGVFLEKRREKLKKEQTEFYTPERLAELVAPNYEPRYYKYKLDYNIHVKCMPTKYRDFLRNFSYEENIEFDNHLTKILEQKQQNFENLFMRDLVYYVNKNQTPEDLYFDNDLSIISYPAFLEKFNEAKEKLNAVKEERKQAKKLQAEKFALLIRVSETVFSWGTKLLTLIVVLGLIYLVLNLLYLLAMASMAMAGFIYSNIPSILYGLLNVASVFALVILATFAIKWIIEFLGAFGKYPMKPVAFMYNTSTGILGSMFCALGRKTRSHIYGFVEFFMMFYENNCPPVTIVTPEDEALDAYANGEQL